MRKPGDPPRRGTSSRPKGVRFGGAAAPVPARRSSIATSACSSLAAEPRRDIWELDLGSGWSAVRSVKPALLQADQRAYGRALLQRVCGSYPRPWAVRGEVPYESENCKLCAMVVVSGVRMHLPEKLFGRSWVELNHEPSGVTLVFDAMGALESWADLSTRAFDEQRAGRTAWSGKSVDRADKAAWEARWDSTARLQRREEYDWTYRTEYQGELYTRACHPGDSEDSSTTVRMPGYGSQTIEYWETFRPVCLCTNKRTPSGKPGVPDRRNSPSTSTSTFVWEESQLQSEDTVSMLGSVVEELHTKLYEDFLHDLGIASLALRTRRYEHGWEMRLRWWAVVNPSCTPQRGLPHARLRDTTYRFLNGAAEYLFKDQIEKELYFDAATSGIWNEGVSLDADTMEGTLRPVLPVPTRSLRIMPRVTSKTEVEEAKAETEETQKQEQEQEQEQPEHGGQQANGQEEDGCAGTKEVSSLGSSQAAAGTGATGVRIANGTQGDEVLLMSSDCSVDAVDPMNGADSIGLGHTSILACAWLDTGRISLFSGSRLLWDVPTAAPALESLAFYIPRCNAPSDGASDCDRGGALLTCGVDGHVRAWGLSTGTLQAELKLQGAVGADQQMRGCCVVQRIVVSAYAPAVKTDAGIKRDPVQAHRIVAACGRSVFAIRLILPNETAGLQAGLGSKGQLLAAKPRPALPSMIVDLAYVFSDDTRKPGAGTDAKTQAGAGSIWCCSLVVATSTAGVFIWEGAAAVNDHSAPPSRRLTIGSACVSLSVLSPSLYGIGSCRGCLVAGCSDRTVRIWSWMDIVCGDELAPMTFGGVSATARVGSDVPGGWFSASSDGAHLGVGADVLSVADRSGGLVCWLLSDSSKISAGDRSIPSAGDQSTLRQGQRLWTEGALGVESSRTCRLYPWSPATAPAAVVATLVLPPISVPVTRGATGDRLSPGCSGSDSSPVTRTRIACADAHGTVHILVGTRGGSPGDGSPAYLFGDGVEHRLQIPMVHDTLERVAGARGGSVEQLAMAGEWLYGATEDGAVVAWPIDRQ